MRYFRKNLKTFGLTEQQWRVIRALDQFGELEAGKIAEEACILSPSLSGVLDRMEKADLIVRYRLSIDQRKVFVDLTPRSRKIVASLSGSIEQQYLLLEKLIGEQSLAALDNLLDQLIALPDPDMVEIPITRQRLRTRRIKKESA